MMSEICGFYRGWDCLLCSGHRPASWAQSGSCCSLLVTPPHLCILIPTNSFLLSVSVILSFQDKTKNKSGCTTSFESSQGSILMMVVTCHRILLRPIHCGVQISSFLPLSGLPFAEIRAGLEYKGHGAVPGLEQK